jgi:hypothetical protein
VVISARNISPSRDLIQGLGYISKPLILYAQTLNIPLPALRQGGSPTCCVCQDGCPLSSRPTFMRCAHFACEDCIVQWVRFEQSKGGGGGASAGGAGGKATCPLCRKQFRLADLIRIIAPTAPPPMPSTASSSLGKKSSANKPSGKGCSSSSSSSSSSRLVSALSFRLVSAFSAECQYVGEPGY